MYCNDGDIRLDANSVNIRFVSNILFASLLQKHR